MPKPIGMCARGVAAPVCPRGISAEYPAPVHGQTLEHFSQTEVKTAVLNTQKRVMGFQWQIWMWPAQSQVLLLCFMRQPHQPLGLWVQTAHGASRTFLHGGSRVRAGRREEICLLSLESAFGKRTDAGGCVPALCRLRGQHFRSPASCARPSLQEGFSRCC